MSLDLVTLRIMLVSSSRPDRELLRLGATTVSVPIDIVEAHDCKAAEAHLRDDEFDIVFIDSALQGADRSSLIAAAQAVTPQPFILFVAVDRDEAHTLAGVGADGAIIKPANADEATALIERCIRSRLTHRVLVVDDSQTMRSIVRKILIASRFRLDIAEAKEGAEALEQIATGYFDLIFLDYNMPGLNGVETLSEIKRRNPLIGVVLMTSTADDVLAEKARKAGAVAFLKKPFYPADIDAILHRIFGMRGGR